MRVSSWGFKSPLSHPRPNTQYNVCLAFFILPPSRLREDLRPQRFVELFLPVNPNIPVTRSSVSFEKS